MHDEKINHVCNLWFAGENVLSSTTWVTAARSAVPCAPLAVRTRVGAVRVTRGGKQRCYWAIFSGLCRSPPLRLSLPPSPSVSPSCQPEVLTPSGINARKNVILDRSPQPVRCSKGFVLLIWTICASLALSLSLSVSLCVSLSLRADTSRSSSSVVL